MPTSAKTYICLVSAIGILASAAAFWNPGVPHDLLRFGIYFLLSLLASMLKLRLPGITGTMSIGFVFVLLGISELSLPETLVIACSGILVQCYWRALRRPSAVQVLFNVAATACSVCLAYPGAHLAAARSRMDSVTIPMTVATCIYFLAGSLLVTGVLSLVERQSMRTVWERCYLLSCPYYLLGGVIAGLVAAASRQMGWQVPLVILPVMALAYLFYRMCLARLSLEPRAGLVLESVESGTAVS